MIKVFHGYKYFVISELKTSNNLLGFDFSYLNNLREFRDRFWKIKISDIHIVIATLLLISLIGFNSFYNPLSSTYSILKGSFFLFATLMITALHKKWSFSLWISSVNANRPAANLSLVTFTKEIRSKLVTGHFYWRNPQQTAGLVTFTEEILNWKIHFLRSVLFCFLAWVVHECKCQFTVSSYHIIQMCGKPSNQNIWETIN